MTEQEIERCLERFAMGKACDVMNFDYAGTLAYLQRLKAENAALPERLDKAERRAEVAERALLTACVRLVKDEEDSVNIELLARVVYARYLANAKKEIEK